LDDGASVLPLLFQLSIIYFAFLAPGLGSSNWIQTLEDVASILPFLLRLPIYYLAVPSAVARLKLREREREREPKGAMIG
jgi:hypothetical protein